MHESNLQLSSNSGGLKRRWCWNEMLPLHTIQLVSNCHQPREIKCLAPSQAGVPLALSLHRALSPEQPCPSTSQQMTPSLCLTVVLSGQSEGCFESAPQGLLPSAGLKDPPQSLQDCLTCTHFKTHPSSPLLSYGETETDSKWGHDLLKNKANQLLEPKHRPSDSSASTTPSIPLLEGMTNIGHVRLGSQAGESAFHTCPQELSGAGDPWIEGNKRQLYAAVLSLGLLSSALRAWVGLIMTSAQAVLPQQHHLLAPSWILPYPRTTQTIICLILFLNYLILNLKVKRNASPLPG